MSLNVNSLQNKLEFTHSPGKFFDTLVYAREQGWKVEAVSLCADGDIDNLA